MNIKRGLQAWFCLVLMILLGATVYASLGKNVLQAYADLGRDPWGLATLFDAYFAFTVFSLWVAYKEQSAARGLLWFVLIMALGNFAISGYLLWRLAAWDPATGAAGFLLRAEKAGKKSKPKRKR
jgi:hypothetical protein